MPRRSTIELYYIKFVTLTIVNSIVITCVSIFCFAGTSLVLFYCDFIGSEQHFLPEKIEHLSLLLVIHNFTE